MVCGQDPALANCAPKGNVHRGCSGQNPSIDFFHITSLAMSPWGQSGVWGLLWLVWGKLKAQRPFWQQPLGPYPFIRPLDLNTVKVRMGNSKIENTMDRRKGCLFMAEGRADPATSPVMGGPGCSQHAGFIERETETEGRRRGGRERKRGRYREQIFCLSFSLAVSSLSDFGLQCPTQCLAFNR